MSKFIGRRIVPTHGGVWEQTKEYEELTIVLDSDSGDSYISRIPVPSGTALTDEKYWMLYSIYSAQIAEAVKKMEETEQRLTAHVDATEQAVNEHLDATETAMENRVKEAETLTDSNKSELNTRMDTIDKRLDANVTASTDKNADYAAEVVDARTHENGTVYTSLGEHLRQLDGGAAVTALDSGKVQNIDLSMKKFYELGVEKKTDYFSFTYTAETDTLRIVCLKDNDTDFILFAPLWTPKEYAQMRKVGGKLFIKYKGTDIKNNNNVFKMGLWLGKEEDGAQYHTGSIFSSTFIHAIQSGEVEVAAPFTSGKIDFDEDRGVYVKDDKAVNLQLLLYANYAREGDEVTICGYGGLLHGVTPYGGNTLYGANQLRAEMKSMTERITNDESESAKVEKRVSEIEPTLDILAANDARNCRCIDFAPDGIFGNKKSVCEIVEDEYGDSSYQVTFVEDNPMYQMYLEDYLLDDDREVIVELQARNTDVGSKLRVQLYDYSCGLSQNQTQSTYREITSDYRRYQFRLDRRNSGKTAIGIGPERTENAVVQFKDVKILIPNEDSKQVQVPLKHFYGYPADVDFSSASEVKLDNPLIFGIDDYAQEDGLYLDSVEVYSTKFRSAKFYVGCIDQYGLLQIKQTFTGYLRKGRNFLKFDDRKISVPAGYGLFVEWHADMAVYEGMPEWGYHNLISTKSNYFENAAGYSGYPLYETSYMIPMRYTLVGQTLPVRLDEIESTAKETQAEVDELKENANKKEIISFIAPDGVKYSPTVSSDGTLSMIRSIPRKVEVFGNSLTLGFGTFGMAASDSKHDYFYYVQQFLLGKNADLVMNRHGASTWEGKTDSESRKTCLQGFIDSYIDGTEDLVIIQLSDNVNTDAKKATFPEDAVTMLQMFREACPKARIVWIAAWYNSASNFAAIKSACEEMGTDLVDIIDLSSDKANKSAIGNTYTKDDGTVVEITSSGVASHPGDTGMKLIADRVIKLLESYM